MPVGMPDLNRSLAGLHTHAALVEMLDGARETVDCAVMYWSLLPEACGWRPNATRSASRTARSAPLPDCAGFTQEDLNGRFLAQRGRAVHDALVRALARGVQFRVLQSAGFPSESDSGTGGPNPESAALAKRFPASFTVRTLNMSAWYGDGIQHAKFLVVDGAHLLLGSSNFMDFRSLSLVKELGIRVQHSPALAGDLTMFFDDAFSVAAVDHPARYTGPFWDPSALRYRDIPSWSALRDPTNRSASTSPLPRSSPATRENPLHVAWSHGDGAVFISCSPVAFCGGGGGGIYSRPRTTDESTLVTTILSANTDVAVAVMDFLPSSMSLWSRGPPVFWPSLIDALVRVVNAKGVRARLLVSQWAWTDPTMLNYMRALTATAGACKFDDPNQPRGQCRGSLEVRVFTVPGWNSTLGAARAWPGHSRVNHNKYIVTDSTANIATSNMAWSYFYTTLGASINIRDPEIAKSLMQRVFDRDWDSAYASAIL